MEPADAHTTVNGRRHAKNTTKGSKLCVIWKDGSLTWERLAKLNELNPIEVAKHAKAHGINRLPAFAWWVDYTLKKRERIISTVNNRYLKRTHKFGIRLPKLVIEAYDIYWENGDTLWTNGIAK